MKNILLIILLTLFVFSCSDKDSYEDFSSSSSSDSAGPTITSTSPSSSSYTFASEISITFSEPMKTETLTGNECANALFGYEDGYARDCYKCEGSFQISEDSFNTCLALGADNTSISWSDSDQTATISLGSNYDDYNDNSTLHTVLKNNTTYKVRLTTSLENTSGTSLNNQYEFSFKTPWTVIPKMRKSSGWNKIFGLGIDSDDNIYFSYDTLGWQSAAYRENSLHKYSASGSQSWSTELSQGSRGVTINGTTIYTVNSSSGYSTYETADGSAISSTTNSATDGSCASNWNRHAEHSPSFNQRMNSFSYLRGTYPACKGSSIKIDIIWAGNGGSQTYYIDAYPNGTASDSYGNYYALLTSSSTIELDSYDDLSPTGGIGTDYDIFLMMRYTAHGYSAGLSEFNIKCCSSSEETAGDIAIDSSDNIFIVGQRDSDTLLLAKYNTSGSRLWLKEQSADLATNLNTNNGHFIFVDDSAIYVASDVDSVSQSEDGIGDIMVFKFDKDGNILWSKRIAPTECNKNTYGNYFTFYMGCRTRAKGLVVDSSGNVYVAGYSEGIIDGAKDPRLLNGNRQEWAKIGFVTKLDSTGTKL